MGYLPDELVLVVRRRVDGRLGKVRKFAKDYNR